MGVHVKHRNLCPNLSLWLKSLLVSLEDTITGFTGILAGDYDDLPEQAFYMVGDMDEVKEKATKLAGDVGGKKKSVSDDSTVTTDTAFTIKGQADQLAKGNEEF